MLQIHRAPGSGWFSFTGMCYLCMRPDLPTAPISTAQGSHCWELRSWWEGAGLVFPAQPNLFVTCLALFFPWSFTLASLDFALEECWPWGYRRANREQR